MNVRKVVLRAIYLVTLVSVFCFSPLTAAFAEYPSGPVFLVVPFGPGGSTDTIARSIAPLLEEKLHQSMIVVNKSGASGAVGTSFTLGKEADGQTILVSAETPAVFRTMGLSDKSFNDFTPIMMLGRLTPAVTVNANASWNGIDELIAYAKANPGKVTAGYAGPGTTGHIAALLFAEAAGIKLKTIPFGGGGKVNVALLGGHVDVVFNLLGSVIDPYKAGKMKILATFSLEQIAGLDEIPPIVKAEPKFAKYLPWGPFYSLQVKKGTPDAVVSKLKQVTSEIMQDPRWQKVVSDIYAEDAGLQGDNLAKFMQSWESLAAWLLYDAGAASNSPDKFGIAKP